MAAKARFIVRGPVFFIVYHFALPIFVGYAPKFMNRLSELQRFLTRLEGYGQSPHENASPRHL
jgi:hypothetical protein